MLKKLAWRLLVDVERLDIFFLSFSIYSWTISVDFPHFGSGWLSFQIRKSMHTQFISTVPFFSCPLSAISELYTILWFDILFGRYFSFSHQKRIFPSIWCILLYTQPLACRCVHEEGKNSILNIPKILSPEKCNAQILCVELIVKCRSNFFTTQLKFSQISFFLS